jgi:hypothetical protein
MQFPKTRLKKVQVALPEPRIRARNEEFAVCPGSPVRLKSATAVVGAGPPAV